MPKLAVTNVRLTRQELRQYRPLALHEGKSFAAFARQILEHAAYQQKVWGKVDTAKSI